MNELMEGVKTWLSSQVAGFVDTGIALIHLPTEAKMYKLQFC
jgi:hypothetical protein